MMMMEPELAAENEALRAALRAFLNLVKPDPRNPRGNDALAGLPDSHAFTLIWAACDDDGDLVGHERVILAGQIRRAMGLVKE